MTVYDKQPAVWEALDQHPPLFASADWLRHLAHRMEGEHRWFVTGDETGEGVGFFGTLIDDPAVTKSQNVWDVLFDPYAFMRTLTEESIERQRRVREAAAPREAWSPALLLTYPGFECFGIGPGARDRRPLAAAVDEIVDAGRRMGARAVLFHFVQPEEPLLGEVLLDRGFLRAPSAIRANLPLPGSGFEDYLGMLKGRRARDVRRSRRTLAEAGVRIGKLALDQCSDTDLDILVALRESHRARYGKRADPAAERRQLTELRGGFGERGTVFTASVDGRMIGFSLLLDVGGIYHGWLTGTDYSDKRSKLTYFELGYFAPIEHVYANGGGELSFGYGTQDAKLSRGCRLEVVTSFVLALDPALKPHAEAATAALQLAMPAFEAVR